MKILIDTSTLYSAITHNGTINTLIEIIQKTEKLVLTDYIIEELKTNFRDTYSGKNQEEILQKLENLISNCEIKTKDEYIKHLPKAKNYISNKDAPILAAGMLKDIDYLITSDKEFHNINPDKVTIIKPENTEKIL